MSAHVSTPQTFVGTFRAMSETPEAYDAIIIGAGVIGWIPYYLERADDNYKTHMWAQGAVSYTHLTLPTKA